MMFYLMMNRTIIEEWVFSGILIAGHKPHGAGCPAGESGDDSDDIWKVLSNDSPSYR